MSSLYPGQSTQESQMRIPGMMLTLRPVLFLTRLLSWSPAGKQNEMCSWQLAFVAWYRLIAISVQATYVSPEQ
jgi:hypothetical protein